MDEQLLGYLFDDKPHVLAGRVGEWIGASPRFKSFAETYRDKIRKKIRITRSPAAIEDLEAELETAFWLLGEKRLGVVYEPYGSEKTRGPDYGVQFKSLTFNVEVTRIHIEGAADDRLVNGRLMDSVCDKLGQMRPGMVNVLVVVMEREFARLAEVEGAMTQLKLRAERKEAGLFGRYGFVKAADFFKYFLRLSGVVVRSVGEDGTAEVAVWVNNQTKHPIPGPVKTILSRGQQPGVI